MKNLKGTLGKIWKRIDTRIGRAVAAFIVAPMLMYAYNPYLVAIVPSIATLQAQNYSGVYVVFVEGYTGVGTAGGGFFIQNSGAGSTNACTVIADSAGTKFQRFGGISSVQDCGALPDGVTDATTAFQAAIDVQSAIPGGAVSIPAGSSCYVFANSLVAKTGVKLQGTGSPCLSFSDATVGAAVYLCGTDISITGITFTTEPKAAIGPYTYGCTNARIHISNNVFTGTRSAVLLDGLNATGSISGTVMTITSITAGNISVGQSITGTSVTGGTTVTSFGTGTGGVGTYNLSASSSVGSETLSTTTTVDDVYVEDNVMQFGVNYGFQAGSRLIGNRYYVRGNHMLGMDADGVELNVGSGASNFIVTGNYIDANGGGSGTNSGFGFGMANASNVVFSNNIIAQSRREGIHLEGPASNVVITNNNVTMTTDFDGLTNPDTDAITNSIVANNTFTAMPGNSSHGYASTPQAGVAVTGNTFTGWLVGIQASPGATTANNRVLGGGGAGTCIAMQGSAVSTETTHDNLCDSYATVISVAGGGIIGRVNIIGTTPTTVVNSTGTGPFQIDGLTISGSTTLGGTGSPQTVAVMPAPARYMGLADFTLYNPSTPSRRVSSSGFHVYDGTTDTTAWIAASSGGSPTTQMFVSRTNTYSAPSISFSGGNTNYVVTSSNADLVNWTVTLDKFITQ